MSTMTETSVTTQVYRVYIKATPQAIWDAITKPEWTERYGYGGRADFGDLTPGSHYKGYTSEAMREFGAPEVGVDGEVIEAEPPRRLVQTWRMAMDDQMKAQGFTRVTYEIEERPNGVSRLTVIHNLDGAPILASLMNGEMEDQGAGGGWAYVLSSLKTLLETGESFVH